MPSDRKQLISDDEIRDRASSGKLGHDLPSVAPENRATQKPPQGALTAPFYPASEPSNHTPPDGAICRA